MSTRYEGQVGKSVMVRSARALCTPLGQYVPRLYNTHLATTLDGDKNIILYYYGTD